MHTVESAARGDWLYMIDPVVETIAAIATPRGRGGVGILRLSGPRARAIASCLVDSIPPPRVASLRHFRDATNSVVDRGLVLFFEGPSSFTGEDVVELHAHGGPVLLQLLLRAACVAGARPARAGEFSERAYLNGRIDLTQAEAIADLIDAASGAAVRAAQRSLDGEFSREVTQLATEVIDLRTRLEGALDFADEDIDWSSNADLQRRAADLDRHLLALLDIAGRGRRLRDGMIVAISGQPNVGKSTLLNRLAGADSAIVTERPGTTRDVLREHVLIDEIPVTLVDMAGLRETEDPIELEGIRRARTAMARADALLYLFDDREGFTETDSRLLDPVPAETQRIFVHSKCDLSGYPARRWVEGDNRHIRISAMTDEGLAPLHDQLKELAGLENPDESLFSARSRHLEFLRRAHSHLQRVVELLSDGMMMEVAAEELRLAHQFLCEITGSFTTEDLLGQIFSSFCIGK